MAEGNPYAKLLQEFVRLHFDGSVMRAAIALKVDRPTFWRYVTGREKVSRPVWLRVHQFAENERREQQRRALEALERHERNGAIILERHEFRTLTEQLMSPRERQRIEIAARKDGIAERSAARKKRAA